MRTSEPSTPTRTMPVSEGGTSADSAAIGGLLADEELGGDEAQTDDSTRIEDELGDEHTVPAVSYEINSYGADFDVDGLVSRLKRGDILIPTFQRDYVWTIRDASRFIESLLLGLPVPGIFFDREQTTQKLLVIDGQQRLKTLDYYFSGFFDPRSESRTRKVFKLVEVQKRFNDRTYEELDEPDQVRLRDSIIHATIVQQDSPSDDDTSVYHIFERLNTGGRRLLPQQIRAAISHGPLMDMIGLANQYEPWRRIFGPRHKAMKDQELILRFLALYVNRATYKQPMTEFLSSFAQKNREASPAKTGELAALFRDTIDLAWKIAGAKAFRIERAFNAAVFDSMMIALAYRRHSDKAKDLLAMQQAYNGLLTDEEYRRVTSRATANEENLKRRIDMARAAFAG